MPNFENVSDQPEANANRSKGKGPFNFFRKENKELKISSEDRRGKHILEVVKKLEILKDGDPEYKNIRIKEGKIELLNDKEKADKTLDKQENPARFLQFEYKLREHLVKEALSNSNELSGKEITEVEKKEGVYKIECTEEAAEGNKTIKYEIKKKDGRYHLFDNNDNPLGDVQDRVYDWEKTIRDLKLEVRNIHIPDELNKSVKDVLLSRNGIEGEGSIVEHIGEDGKISKENSKKVIRDGQIVDYDKENHTWTIRTENGEWYKIQSSEDEEKEIEDKAAAKIVGEEVQRTDKGVYQVKKDDNLEDIRPDQMKSIESEARIANVSFTEKEAASFINMEDKNELEDMRA